MSGWDFKTKCLKKYICMIVIHFRWVTLNSYSNIVVLIQKKFTSLYKLSLVPTLYSSKCLWHKFCLFLYVLFLLCQRKSIKKDSKAKYINPKRLLVVYNGTLWASKRHLIKIFEKPYWKKATHPSPLEFAISPNFTLKMGKGNNKSSI